MTLPIVWFILIAVLWTGYLALEGFDFGVGSSCAYSGATSASAAPWSAPSAPTGTATRCGC